MSENTIEIKFIVPNQIDISRKTYVNGVESYLCCTYFPIDNSNQSVSHCLNCFFEAWEKEMFVPRLENEKGESYGEIGKLTDLVDINGKLLSVGDQVLVYDVSCKSREVSVICENLRYRDSTEGPKYEIMGYFGLKWEKGFNHKDYFIIKLSSFEKAEHNNECHKLKYILKPE